MNLAGEGLIQGRRTMKPLIFRSAGNIVRLTRSVAAWNTEEKESNKLGHCEYNMAQASCLVMTKVSEEAGTSVYHGMSPLIQKYGLFSSKR